MTVLFGIQDELRYDFAFTMREKGREWTINALARPMILSGASGLDERWESADAISRQEAAESSPRE